MNDQMWTMLAGIIIRGLVWVLGATCGWEATRAQQTAEQAVYGAVAIVSIVGAIWQSYRSRRKLLATPPTSQS